MEQSRLNLKIPATVKAYLEEISWQKRTSVTKYIVSLVENDMKDNMRTVLKIKGEQGRV